MDKYTQKWNIPIYCESCKACNKSGDDFRKLISLTNSGLTVYINRNERMDTNKKESVILHNVGDKVLKKSDFFNELCHRKTKCYLCNTLIQKVCNLVNEIQEIKENEMIAICEHCKRSNAANKCKKCDDTIKRFLNKQIHQYAHRQQALKTRLCEVRRILSLILDKKNVCDHKICQAYYDSNAELKILLELIKSPLPSKQPDIDEYFPLIETRDDSVGESFGNHIFLKYTGSLYQSKEMLDASTSETRTGSFCICKYLRDKNFDLTQSFELSPKNILSQERSTPSILKEVTTVRSPADKTPIFKKKVKNKARKSFQKKSNKDKQVNMENNKENIAENEQTATEKNNAEYNMTILKDEERKRATATNKDKIYTMPKFDDLPKIKTVKNKSEVESETTESIIECVQKEPLYPLETIYGNNIIPLQKRYEFREDKPLFYKVKHKFVTAEKTSTKTIGSASEPTTLSRIITHRSGNRVISNRHIRLYNSIENINSHVRCYDKVEQNFPGIIKYDLSNKEYIDKGWTQLPSTKIVRKMNIYKMVPANPQFDWFANHSKENLFYNTGTKLAEVDENGSGRWFYKDGRVALEYYKSKDINSGLRYVVYDIEDTLVGKKNKLRKILASFDHLGNGIIYDNIGNARLKYNQSEGLVIDKKIGPPGRWKWHTLNDPPVLQHVYLETVEESYTRYKNVVKQHINDSDLCKRPVNEHMLAIEFDNFVKEKALKLLQSFKPFEIRMKAVKINEYFSVRIINQANVQLLFRSNQVSLKVNMGMLLISNEIIDTRVSDVADVATPFDRPISMSKSVSSI